MIKPLYQYVHDEALPRARKILLGPESAAAIAVSVLCLKWGGKWFALTPKIGDLATGLIAYSAIALGFCVAGLTICLTLPDHDFASQLALLKKEREPTNGYSDLLFVFSWTAIAHWVALAMLFLMTMFVESSSALFPAGGSLQRNCVVSLIAGVCTYCLCQFLIILITLSQVGQVYIQHLIEKHADEVQKASEG